WAGSTLAPGLKFQLPTTRRIADIKTLNPQGADFRQFGLQHHFHIGIAPGTLQAHHKRWQWVPGVLRRLEISHLVGVILGGGHDPKSNSLVDREAKLSLCQNLGISLRAALRQQANTDFLPGRRFRHQEIMARTATRDPGEQSVQGHAVNHGAERDRYIRRRISQLFYSPSAPGPKYV